MKYTLMAILGLSLLLPIQDLPAQNAGRTSERGQDLWGTWRDGFQTFDRGEKALQNADFERALEYYRDSLQLFREVRKINSEWNKGVISYRIDLCLRRIRYTQEKRDEAASKKASVKKTEKPAVRSAPLPPQPKRYDFVQESIKARARLAEAEKKIVSLKRSIELNSKASQQVQDLIREKNELIRKNAAIALLLENTKAQLARAGKNAEKDRRIVELRSELTRLNSKIRNMNVDMETLKLQKAEAQEKRNEAELALRSSAEKVAALTAALEASKLVQQENRNLTEQLVRMKTDKQELETKLTDAQQQVRTLSSQIAKFREGIDLPENIRKIQDHANVVLKDNEYLRTLNAKNMKELELLKKSNAASALELKKTTELYLLSTREYTKAAKDAADAGFKQAAAEREAAQYKNSLAIMQRERDNLKTELAEFAKKYEVLLKNANRTDTLSAELLKRDEELKKISRKAAELDLASAKLRQEKDSLLAELTKTRENAEKADAERKNRYDELKKSTDKLSAENIALIASAEALRASLAKSEELNRASAQLREENIKLKREAAVLNETVQTLKADDSSMKLSRENIDLKKQAAVLQLRIENAEKETREKTAQYQELQKRAEELRHEFGKLSEERRKLTQANRQLAQKAGDARISSEKYKEAVANNNSLSSEYQKLKKEFDSFREDVSKTNEASFSAAQISQENKRLKRESAELRASLDNLKQESGKIREESGKEVQEARRKQMLAEAGLAASLAANAKQNKLNEELQKEIASLKKNVLKQDHVPDRLDAALKENAALKADVALLKGTVERLLKQSDQAAGAKAALAENESLKSDTIKLRRHIEELSAELRKNENLRKSTEEQMRKLQASGRNSEAFLKQRDELIRKLNDEIRILKVRAGKGSGKEIAELAATVTELKEGKAQFETALRTLNESKVKLEKDNAVLKIELEKAERRNAALQKTLAGPKPQGELERRNLALLASASKFEKLYQQSNQERIAMAERLRKLDMEMKKSKQELAASSVTIERMRKEIQEWSDDPAGMNDRSLRDKESAIDGLAKEGVELRKEVAKLKSQLASSREDVRRYQEKMVAMEKRFQVVLASIQDYKSVNTNEVLSAELRRQEELKAEEQKQAQREELASRTDKPVKTEPDLKEVKEKPETAVKTENPEKTETAAKTEKKEKTEAAILPPAEEISPAEKKRFEEAMRLAEKAEKKKDTAGALMNYWRATDANPNSAEAHRRLARIYFERGESVSAAKAYEKSIQLGAKADEEFEAKLKEGK